MYIKRDKVRNKTFKHIEQELFFYHETRKRIELKREELMTNAPAFDNIGGGRSNLPGDPTGKLAVKLADAERTDKELSSMTEIVRAIEHVFENGNETEKNIIKLYYWAKPQHLTPEGISHKIFISTRHMRRIRYNIACKIAYLLGWW